MNNNNNNNNTRADLTPSPLPESEEVIRDRARRELALAIHELNERGLYHSAKWYEKGNP